MSERVCAGRWIAASRVALVAVIGSAVSACGSDTVRFSEAFTNPFSASERLASSEPAAPPQQQTQVAAVSAVPTALVQSQALPPISAAPVPRVAAAPAPVVGGTAGWTAAGGTRIVVAPNDNLQAISNRYGVPASAILASNGLSSPSQVAPGAQIVIPVYHAGGSSTQIAAVPPMPAPKARAAAPQKPAPVKTAAVATTPVGRVRPGMTAPAAAPTAKPLTAQPSAAPTPAPVAAPQQLAARPEPQPAKPAATAYASQPAPQQEVAKATPPEPEQTGALGNDFRWPARGRVIAGFGANGGNEGINIAVPEGTPVKAAEAGVVTYAGDEVKGYGNLVLIRHDNGYVTAYAHNGSINVKRGERVKRGQVIATSGQTGNVTSPQLHFEIRKGQVPLDPMPHLSGA